MDFNVLRDIPGSQISVSTCNVLPLALSSSTKWVRGGIAPFEGKPRYYYDNRFVAGNLVSRNKFRNRDVPTDPNASLTPVFTDEPHFYMGPFHRQFGHFVLESLSRIWALKEAEKQHGGSLRLLFLPETDSYSARDDFAAQNLEHWQRGVLEHLGVNLELLTPITRPTRFERLYVAEQGYLWGRNPAAWDGFALHEYKSLLPKLQNQEMNKYFFSRGLLQTGRVAGETYLAKYFQDFGYKVLDPVQTPLVELLEKIGSASHVFGASGSSFHNINLVNNPGLISAGLTRTSSVVAVNFESAIRPFVRQFKSLDPQAFIAKRHDLISSEAVVIHTDTTRLKRFIHEFDPEINLKHFNDDHYLKCVTRELQNAFFD